MVLALNEKIIGFFQKLIMPHASIIDEDERQKAKNSSALLLFLSPLTFLGSLLYVIFHSGDLWIKVLYILAAFLFPTLYFLSRSRHYKGVIFFLVVVITVMPYLILSLKEELTPLGMLIILAWSLLGIILLSLILSPESISVLLVLNLAVIWISHYLHPEIPDNIWQFIFGYLLSIALIIYCFTIIRFHTANKIKEKKLALEESEERSKIIFEAALMAMVIVDNDKILDVNESFEKLTGYSEEEALEIPFSSLFPDKIREDLKKRKTTEIPDLMDVNLITKDNRDMIVEMTARECRFHGKEAEVISLRNVTERKMMEEKLIRKNNELNDFTYIVSHDLKNPINIMKGYLIKIKEKPELFEKYYDRVIAKTDDLFNFIDKLLKLSRSGRIVGTMMTIKPLKLIKVIFDFHENDSVKSELIVKTEIPSVLGDPVGINQVFSNIIDNAYKYRDPGKDKLIIEVGHFIKDNMNVIYMKDNGIGVTEKESDRLFDAGYVIKKNQSTGFGLAIVRKIINAHGGEVWLESDGENQGTTFFVSLPVIKA